MNEPERIAQLFDRVVAEGAFAGPLPFGADVFVEAAKYLRQQAATIAQLIADIQQVRAGYLESHLMLMAERDKALGELRSSQERQP